MSDLLCQPKGVFIFLGQYCLNAIEFFHGSAASPKSEDRGVYSKNDENKMHKNGNNVSDKETFSGDHTPPHFHASNNENEGLFKIEDLEMFKGDLNSKDQKKVKKWAEPRKTKLKDMWDAQDIQNID